MVFIAKEGKKLNGSKPNENRNLLFGEHMEEICALRSGTEVMCIFINLDGGSVTYNEVLH